MDIKEAVEEYFRALNAMFAGDAEHIKHLWSHSADAVFYGPDASTLTGWEAVETLIDQHAAMNIGGFVEPSGIHYVEGGELTVVYSNVKGYHHIGGKQQPVDIRASMVFREESGEWKVVALQTDILPFILPLDD